MSIPRQPACDRRTEAKRDGLALVNLALEWKAQFEAKGWTA